MANSISGNTGLAGALVVLGGAATSTTVADGSGNYTFSGLAAGNYVIVVQSAGYSFSPNGSPQTIVASNITGVNFTATATNPVGTWTKHGVVVSNSKSAYEPCVIREGNAQILSGTVFKMWYLGGGYTSGGIYYAESTDGINWTQYSGNPVIAGANSGSVFKNGSTYYGYYVLTSSNFAHINQYTSTDGVTWSLAHSSVLSIGSAGAWDASQIYNMHVVGIISGTWYALYGGNQNNNILGTGLVTSPDGVTWTKSASNPVIWNFAAGNVVQVGSTYYTWGDTTVYAKGGSVPFEFPANLSRSSSTDLIHWTVPIPSLQASLPFESDGAGNYQLDTAAVLEFNGQVYMWYWGSPTAYPGTNGQIGLAIANGTLAQLVQISGGEGVIGTGISLVQEKDNLAFPSSSATLVTAYTSNVTAGNLLLYWVEQFSTFESASVADTLGNNWFQVLEEPNSNNTAFLQLFAAWSKSSGANTVTATSGTAMTFPAGQLSEWSGSLATGIDHTGVAQGAGVALSAAVLAQAKALLYGTYAIGSTTVSAAAGWTSLNGLTGQQGGSVYATEPSSGTYSPSMTQAGTSLWAAIAISIPATLAAAPLPPVLSKGGAIQQYAPAKSAPQQCGSHIG